MMELSGDFDATFRISRHDSDLDMSRGVSTCVSLGWSHLYLWAKNSRWLMI